MNARATAGPDVSSCHGVTLQLSSVLLAVVATACTSNSGRPVQATWTFDTVDATGTLTPVTSCPTGYDTIELHSAVAAADGTPADACLEAGSDCYIDLFDCDAGGGTTYPLPAQSYVSWIVVASQDRTMVYAVSIEQPIDVTTHDGTFDASILENGGYFRAEWTLVDSTTSQPVTCQQAGISSVVFSTVTGTSPSYPCDSGLGYSAPLPGDSVYPLTLQALDATMADDGDASLGAQTLGTAPNQIIDLGSFAIPVPTP